MQGVDTVLFSLCHGNNTKPNCPPFCLSTCIYFVSLFSFLSLACTVSSLGVRLSPSPRHSPAPGTNYIMQARPFQFRPSEGRTCRILDPFSLLAASHLFNAPKIPLETLSSVALPSLQPSQFLPLPMKFLMTARMRVLLFLQQPAHRCVTHYLLQTAIAAGCLPPSLTVLSELSPHPRLSAVL